MSKIIELYPKTEKNLRDLFVSVSQGFYIEEPLRQELITYTQDRYDLSRPEIARVVKKGKEAEKEMNALKDKMDDVMEDYWDELSHPGSQEVERR